MRLVRDTLIDCRRPLAFAYRTINASSRSSAAIVAGCSSPASMHLPRSFVRS